MSALDFVIDIMVICYERSPIADACLDSIRQNTVPGTYRLEVIEGRRSAAANRNIALDKVRSPWFVMMDDDVLVPPGWLPALLRHATSEIGQLQPKLRHCNGRIFAAEKLFVTPWGENSVVGAGEKDRGQFDYVREVEMLSGTCCLYNREILKSCRFDESYQGSQWEDCDFSMQIRQHGFSLVYVGDSHVVHHNLYRESCHSPNWARFQAKWFGHRELINRGVLYVGYACDLNCKFCYYKHEKKKDFKSLDELQASCHEYRYKYGNDHVDITGGEPTLFHGLPELIRYCREIGLAPTVITHGQHLTEEYVRELRDAGLHDLLISIHGLEGVHDCLTEREGSFSATLRGVGNARAQGVRFRINSVVTRLNAETLPAMAGRFVELGASGVNFIMFNPWESWLDKPMEDFFVPYSEVAGSLTAALRILDGRGITAYASYMPFCLLPGAQRQVMNFAQYCYENEWGWDYKDGGKLRGEFGCLYSAMVESRRRYEYGVPCQQCACRLICSGLPIQYAKSCGWSELRPYHGSLIRDPQHFRSGHTFIPPHIGNSVRPSAIESLDLLKQYPQLVRTDPLIFHAVTPLHEVPPLSFGLKGAVKRIMRGGLKQVRLHGGRRLLHRLPMFVQGGVQKLLRHLG